MIMKEIIMYIYLIKSKHIGYKKENVRRMRRPAIDWKKMFTKDTSNKGQLSNTIQRTPKTQQ